MTTHKMVTRYCQFDINAQKSLKAQEITLTYYGNNPSSDWLKKRHELVTIQTRWRSVQLREMWEEHTVSGKTMEH